MSGQLQYALADLLQIGFEFDKHTGRINISEADICRVRVGKTPIEFKARLIAGLVTKTCVSALVTVTAGIGLAIHIMKGGIYVGVVNRLTCDDDTALIFSTIDYVYEKHQEITDIIKKCETGYTLEGSKRKDSTWTLRCDKAVDRGASKGNRKNTRAAVS